MSATTAQPTVGFIGPRALGGRCQAPLRRDRHENGADSGGIFCKEPGGIRLEIYSPTGAGEREATARRFAHLRLLLGFLIPGFSEANVRFRVGSEKSLKRGMRHM